MSLVDLILGRRLATDEDDQECVGPLAGVGILGLDALASSAYGPEALLTVMIALGAGGLAHLGVLTALIVALLLLVFVSYRQTIVAYPNGGGAYAVAKENLGRTASLVAAGALAIDYMLNVAVAISAGIGALVSVVPRLLPYTLPLCLAVLLLLAVVNLRGLRESGIAFLAPTYLFVGSLLVVVVIGIYRTVAAGGQPVPVVAPPALPATLGTASTWLLVRAFSSGCTAMTGVEAVSNGVPIFRPPRERRAQQTLTMIVGALAVLLCGIAFLCRTFHVTATRPGEPGYQSIISQVVAASVGRGALYHVTLGSVIAVLALSANTSFAGFPRLCRILAADRFLPEPLMHRGRRLAYSHGIIVLSVLAAILLVVFGGITDALIPLFAIGAFLAFTMSQAGMVAHWRKRLHGPERARARRSLLLNALGAVATAVTLVVVLASKLTEGAWITLLLLGLMLTLFVLVRRHYDFLAEATRLSSAPFAIRLQKPPIAVLPLRRWDAVSLKALQLAMTFSPEVVVVQVLTGDRAVDDLSDRWASVEQPARAAGLAPPTLVVLQSEYRSLFEPLFGYIEELAARDRERQIAVIIPQLVERRWYQMLLHGQTAGILKARLLMRGGPQVVVINTPWYLRDWLPERRRLFRPWFGRRRSIA
jgi:amino acid transporter